MQKRLLTITVENLPRMADYALALVAVDAELGTAGAKAVAAIAATPR